MEKTKKFFRPVLKKVEQMKKILIDIFLYQQSLKDDFFLSESRLTSEVHQNTWEKWVNVFHCFARALFGGHLIAFDT